MQVTHAGDGSALLYVVELGGRIRTIRNGSVEAAPFLDISGRVLAGGEQGLLGLAFPPGYAANGRFYVNFTRNPDGATVVARYRATGAPRIADPSSEEVLLVISQPESNHNGGQIAFGPDGYLYIGMRDGPSWRSETLLTVPLSISSFGEDEAGDLYVTDYAGGAVHRIVAENNPPEVPLLVFPVDGQTGLPATVEFRWNASVDPDGDPVTYLFFLDTDPSFAGTVPVPVSPAGTASAAGSVLPFMLPAAGLALSGTTRRSGQVRMALALLLLLAILPVFAVPGCGGGGGTPGPGAQVVAHPVSGLAPGTVYFWKVAADDGTDSTESATGSFSTGTP